MFQSTSVCTQTDVSWVGVQHVTRNQRPAMSTTNRPVPSVSRSVGTSTRVADVIKTATPVKSSPPKKGTQPNKNIRQRNRLHLFMSQILIL